MKILIALGALVFTLISFAQDSNYPVKNFTYISDSDYRTEVLESDKYVFMIFSSDLCLERANVTRECFLFEKSIDALIPKFSTKIKVVGINTNFDNYQLASEFRIVTTPTVVVMNKGQIIKRFEPTIQSHPQGPTGYLWRNQLLNDVLDMASQFH